MSFRRLALAVLLASAARLGAWELPAGWETRPPDAERITAILDAADQEGWDGVAPGLRDGALRAYETGRASAGVWVGLARWAALLAEQEDRFTSRWTTAINTAKTGHANMARRYPRPTTPLAAHVSRPLAQWLLGEQRFTEKFFGLLSPCDYLPAVLDTLDALWRADPKKFQTYAQLALAIAVVYDVPPPPNWPHSQVSQSVLPRRLPAPAEAFAFFSDADEHGLTLHKLAKLDASTLKFTVDAAAPIMELDWARTVITHPLAKLAKTYSLIRYRTDREKSGQNMWPDATYDLPHILADGGICVDQAYFATEAGKARGVPTIFFHGEGNDGRHAWFGYLDGRQQWQFDAGRIPEENFITGLAQDPQTWGNLSDHELAFLSEDFRTRPAFASSQLHTAAAQIYLGLNRAPAAVTAARKAVNYERRNVTAWETLLAAQAATNAAAKMREATLNEAAAALDRYPDLNARFRQRYANSLRARGETSAADQEERLIARRNQRDRADLAIAQVALTLKRAMDGPTAQPLAEQVKTYGLLVSQFGRDAGVDFYDKIVTPFITRLVRDGHKPEARAALKLARDALTPETGTQLDKEMVKLAATLK